LFRPVIIFSFYLELYKNKCRNFIPCHQTENQNNFRQGTLENDWTSTSELERNVASYTPTSPVPEMNL
jgi:hypothetical protein